MNEQMQYKVDVLCAHQVYGLSRKEIEIVVLWMEGASGKQIPDLVFKSYQRVAELTRNIKNKTGSETVSEVVAKLSHHLNQIIFLRVIKEETEKQMSDGEVKQLFDKFNSFFKWKHENNQMAFNLFP